MKTLKTEKPKSVQGNGANTVETVPPARHTDHPLDKVFGIFKDEPLMDALMERVREDRRAEREAAPTE